MSIQQLIPTLKPFEHVATNLGKNWVHKFFTRTNSINNMVILDQ